MLMRATDAHQAGGHGVGPFGRQFLRAGVGAALAACAALAVSCVTPVSQEIAGHLARSNQPLNLKEAGRAFDASLLAPEGQRGALA